ncbi:alcohol dehydrogenase [Apibacter muscae]|uniref:alcohol dehydrogenase catalytic domain-containing protein n=1 Tax=Apibacter muscae TaxID=2509004 RepID=UPI0011ABBE6B|nr:zinc-binding dehydrogenase [Apibacter muscae]TWP29210.1 alcohol dehydrogenase [Apibacter muscae]
MLKFTAKAWEWKRKGEPNELSLKDFIIEDLKDDEVIVQNHYIGLNPVDWKLIGGEHPSWKTGIIPGVDGAGIIIKTGKNMNHLRVGSRVCYHADLTKNGSFSTHTIVNGKRMIYIPEKVSDIIAASFPCPALTAWQSLKKIPEIKNKYVFVNGAGGSVGYFLTQLLLEKGARVFLTSSEKHHQEFLNMGVIKTLDYRDPSWKDIMSESLNGNLFDVIFDTTNNSNTKELLNLIGYNGHIISIQGRIKENLLSAFTTCISLHEIALGAYHQFASEKQVIELMMDAEHLLNQIGSGKYKLRNYKLSSFDDLPEHLMEMKKNNSELKYIVKI